MRSGPSAPASWVPRNHAYDVIFTSNTTEAINLAAESLCRDTGTDTEPVVLNTLLEHSSNDLPWRKVSRYPLIRLAIDPDGFIDLGQLDTTTALIQQGR